MIESSSRKAEIVKVQLPLFGVGGALIYAKGRDRMAEVQASSEIRQKMGADKKAFFWAVWNGLSWSLGARASDQSW